MNNILLSTDSYKMSHYLQYPPGSEIVNSYIEARGGLFSRTVFIGIQGFIKQYLEDSISQGDVKEAFDLSKRHGTPFNYAGWMHIVNKHGGYLPVEIEALPEGTVTPIGTCLVQVRNTDPFVPWLTSYLETALLRSIWYPTTVCTKSWEAKNVIRSYMEETCDTIDGLDFKLHDFGARGASSSETAGIGGMAHLVNFKGTDTIEAIKEIEWCYEDSEMSGFSIPASEHSTMTSWGRDNEWAACENMIDQFSGEGKIYAVVSDSYDIMHTVNNIWGDQLKDKIMSSGGTLVVRPDSGDAQQMPIDVIQALMLTFGFTFNSKGYKVLPDCIRVIQGDGIDNHDIAEILRRLKVLKISTDNISFGMGGGLLQKLDRDTCKFAMKASAIRVNGIWRDVYKDPVGDFSKKSKRGILSVIRDVAGNVHTDSRDNLMGSGDCNNLLETVYRNGKSFINQNFQEIRNRVESYSTDLTT